MPFARSRGGNRGFRRYTCASVAFAIGDVASYNRSTAVVEKATSSTSVEDIIGVVVEATTTADTSVLVQELEEGDEFVANTTNNSNATHNYQRMVLTDAATVNNTGTDSTADGAMIVQMSPVGAAASKKIACRFVRIQDRA